MADAGGLETSHTKKFSEFLEASGKILGSGLIILNSSFKLEISRLNDYTRLTMRLITIKSPKILVLFLS